MFPYLWRGSLLALSVLGGTIVEASEDIKEVDVQITSWVMCAYRKPQKRRPLHVIKLSCETTKDRIHVTHSFYNILSRDAGDDSGAVRKIHVHLEIH